MNTLRSRLREVGTRPCCICRTLTNRLSGLCSRHHNSLLRYGHPTGRAIRKHELHDDLKLVRRWVRRNRDHPALVSAFASLDRQLALSSSRSVNLAAREGRRWHTRVNLELSRLASHDVTGRQMFEAVASVYVFARRRSGVLPPSGRPLAFAAARAVFSLAPRHRVPSVRRSDGAKQTLTRRLSTVALAKYGAALVVQLQPLLAVCARSIERRRAAAHQPSTSEPS